MSAGTPVAYRWRSGTRFGGDPQKVGEAIDDLAAKNGGTCSPRDLVRAARRPRHACHDLIEWDDAVAAEEHRVTQARRIIRSVTVVEGDEPEGGSAPAFVAVRREGGHGGYMRTADAVAAPDLRATVLDDALRQLRGLEARYGHLAELAGVWEELNRVA